MSLPDFLQLTAAEQQRETARQDKLRQAFFSRVQLSGARLEAARARIIEPDVTGNRLAEALAAQGKYIEAIEHADDPVLKDFYQRISDVIYQPQTCPCDRVVRMVGNSRIALLKYRTIKEIYSLKDGFGILRECNNCGTWDFAATTPEEPATPVSDLALLAI